MKKSLLLVIICFGISSQLCAQEDKYKALFISKFAQYIEWPQGNKSITIGIMGGDNIYGFLSTIASSKTNINVIQVSSPRDVSKCQIIFLSDRYSRQIDDFNTEIGSKSILLISNRRNAVGETCDIGFFITSDGRLKFAISPNEIKRKSMLPSSKLLSLGVEVQ